MKKASILMLVLLLGSASIASGNSDVVDLLGPSGNADDLLGPIDPPEPAASFTAEVLAEWIDFINGKPVLSKTFTAFDLAKAWRDGMDEDGVGGAVANIVDKAIAISGGIAVTAALEPAFTVAFGPPGTALAGVFGALFAQAVDHAIARDPTFRFGHDFVTRTINEFVGE